MGIQAIPIEIALHVASYLVPEDLFHWALSCRQFEYLIRDNAVCRASLQTRPFSREYRLSSIAFSYSKGLRTHVKRRAAVQEARPFSVAVLEGGESLVYANGYLCYTFSQSEARLLNFDGPQRCDWSFDIRHMLRRRLSHVREAHKHKFRPLYYDDGLFSCLYSSKTESVATPLHWLVVIDVDKREILTLCELDRIDDIWVRNTREWLYCGISAETEEDDIRTWVLFQLDARKCQWASNRVLLPEMPHGDMGIGNCFEIFDEFLYGASSRMPVNFDSYESQTWNSFYYVFRFPLGDSESVEVMEKDASWRRWPADGNVDDRWGFLKMVKEETTGEVYLYESRREFLETRPQSQRNCYRKKIVFPWHQLNEPRSWVSKEPRRSDWNSESYREDFHPNDIHHGDDWYRDTTYKVREAPIRTYIPSCRTYIDVIAQLSDTATNRPLLHIRARPRNSCGRNPIHSIKSTSLGAQAAEQESSEDFGVYTWPPKQDLSIQDKQLTSLLKLFNPDTTRDLVWHADERFIFYAVHFTSRIGPRHVVVISFDPSVRLPGIQSRSRSGLESPTHDEDTSVHSVGGLPSGGGRTTLTALLETSDTSRSFGLDLSS